MGTKNNPGNYDCYSKADPDEPLFTLRAKDMLAPMLIELWAAIRELNWTEKFGDLPIPTDYQKKLTEARNIAQDMRDWYEELLENGTETL